MAAWQANRSKISAAPLRSSATKRIARNRGLVIGILDDAATFLDRASLFSGELLRRSSDVLQRWPFRVPFAHLMKWFAAVPLVSFACVVPRRSHGSGGHPSHAGWAQAC